jgi:hypothetical protein
MVVTWRPTSATVGATAGTVDNSPRDGETVLGARDDISPGIGTPNAR